MDIADSAAQAERVVQIVGVAPAPFAPGARRGVTLRDRAAGGVSSDAPTSAVEQVVSPGLFRALGVTLRTGREFGAEDQPGSPLVAIVSEELARRLRADADAIGIFMGIHFRFADTSTHGRLTSQ